MRAPNPSFGQSGLKTLLTRSLIVKLSLKHYTRTKKNSLKKYVSNVDSDLTANYFKHTIDTIFGISVSDVC
jgi:hypothetical protein